MALGLSLAPCWLRSRSSSCASARASRSRASRSRARQPAIAFVYATTGAAIASDLNHAFAQGFPNKGFPN